MKRVVRITEGDIHKMVHKTIQDLVKEDVGGDFNIKNVFHVSDARFEEFKIHPKGYPYLFFSNKPIKLHRNQQTYVCNLSLHNPLVFDSGTSYGYPLWLYLSNGDDELIPEEEFTKEKYDGYLGCPYEFWERVYYDDDIYATDDIPLIVKEINLGYDGVIIEGVQEGNNLDFVDDYIVFDPKQVQIVRRY